MNKQLERSGNSQKTNGSAEIKAVFLVICHIAECIPGLFEPIGEREGRTKKRKKEEEREDMIIEKREDN